MWVRQRERSLPRRSLAFFFFFFFFFLPFLPLRSYAEEISLPHTTAYNLSVVEQGIACESHRTESPEPKRPSTRTSRGGTDIRQQRYTEREGQKGERGTTVRSGITTGITSAVNRPTRPLDSQPSTLDPRPSLSTPLRTPLYLSRFACSYSHPISALRFFNGKILATHFPPNSIDRVGSVLVSYYLSTFLAFPIPGNSQQYRSWRPSSAASMIGYSVCSGMQALTSEAPIYYLLCSIHPGERE